MNRNMSLLIDTFFIMAGFYFIYEMMNVFYRAGYISGSIATSRDEKVINFPSPKAEAIKRQEDA